MTAIAHRENRASRRVMEKIGMTFLRDTTGADLGHRHPEIEVALYAIEREEWLARIGGEPAGDSARRKAPRRSSSR